MRCLSGDIPLSASIDEYATKRLLMAKVLRRKDVGIDCDVEIHAQSEQEIG